MKILRVWESYLDNEQIAKHFHGVASLMHILEFLGRQRDQTDQVDQVDPAEDRNCKKKKCLR